MAASATPAGSQAPLLITVTGLGPRAGTTTTTVALAQAWPGPEPSLVVEADPAGGQLAELVGGDPYLGLASLARVTDPDSPIEAARVVEHVQFLPGGVALLAAPPGRDAARAGLTDSLLAGAGWRSLKATVFADCGVGEPDSVLSPALAAADACLVVVRADHIDPERAGRRILALTERCRRRGVLLIGDSPSGDFASALALPILGALPTARASAQALLYGTRPPRHGRRLLPAARTIAAAVREQLRPPRPAPSAAGRRTRPPIRQAAAAARRPPAAPPTVYRLDPATTSTPVRPRPAPETAAAHTQPEPAPARVPAPHHAAPHHTTPGPIAPSATQEQTNPHDNDRPADSFAPQGHHEPSSTPSASPSSPQRRSEHVLAIKVFGPTRILWQGSGGGEDVEITARLQPRSREVLTVLALHPEGLSRSKLTYVLWGEHPPDRPGGALTNTLSRLRTAIATATNGQVTALLTDDRLHYRLSEVGITVDYWEFTAAVAARRRASGDADQAAACRRIAALATTVLATDLTDAWVEPLREAARRDGLNALSWLARNTDLDPRATLGLLETAIEKDPYNEILWHDILRLHARLGEHDALTRTYSLLTHKLAEIGESPSHETHQLLEHLRRTTK
ncbi:BTAD domain-containing putative transcriptional regulator [Nocardia sp. CA-135398]|uniref:BTAD domain-containing putative transcriptional regulator n=1 Tax=Nocardia sp. CA-135398 TaxID=3239977 RepID=UPI003D987F12